MSKLKIFLLFLSLTAGCKSFSQKPAFLSYENDTWVNATLNRMSLPQKIGQLMMIDVYPDRDDNHKKEIEEIIQKYQPGGILIMSGSPLKTAGWINDFQEISDIPLLTAIDGETGPGFRIDSVLAFPYAQSLGAIQDNELIYQLGKTIGRQMKIIGINMNFAPVADINTNPDNPVINFRSFGENKINVALKALEFAKGIQEEQVAAIAKHFPGHGDTGDDSHFSLPVLHQPLARMDSVELYPFKKLSESGIAGIMTSHLCIPALDPSGRPASLSHLVINGVLQGKMKFSGLVVTDAMNMGGVSMTRGKAEAEALKAGNDLIEFIPDLSKAVSAVEKEVRAGTLTLREIDDKCRKILALKRWLGLHDYHPSSLSGVEKNLNLPGDQLLLRQLAEGSLTVLRNDNVLPLKELNDLNIATVAVGGDTIVPFQRMASRYIDSDHFLIGRDASLEEIVSLAEKLSSYDIVIAGILIPGNFPRNNFKIAESQPEFMRRLVNQNKVVSIFFGNAYGMRFFPEIEKSAALVQAYQPDQIMQELSIQMVFGAVGANGKLAVSIDSRFPAGSGMDVASNSRLKYTIPEEVGISSEMFRQKIDSIAIEGLNAKAYPGCQVLVARSGKVFFHKCYGYLSYDKKEPVTTENLYDFASVTKVSGPLPLLIKLVSDGRLDLNKKMSYYLPLLKNCNKEDILIMDVLTHQARLPAIIPFWNSRLAKNRELREKVFKDHPISSNSVRISSRLWMERKYIDTMYQEIRDIPLLKTKKYNYTCMGFTLWPLVIENITHQPYETYLKNTIYKPLGASTLTYNPSNHFPVSRMVPTESDDYFRKEVLRGYVHDEGAAMLGGVSGNAGLFGTVNDLAKLFQLYLWKGYYGGDRYFSEKTFNEFNRVHFAGNENWRGLGFDKPFFNNGSKTAEQSYLCKSAGPNSFGHTGYTGTFVWADPDKEFLLIFFTNRVYPTRNNDLLSGMRIRRAILQTIYDAIEKGNN